MERLILERHVDDRLNGLATAVLDGIELWKAARDFSNELKKILSDYALEIKLLVKQGKIKESQALSKWQRISEFLHSKLPRTWGDVLNIAQRMS